MRDSLALASEHWDWLSGLLAKVYKDAFEHGYKHGYDDALNNIEVKP